jgi:phage gp36-like protein
MPIQLFPVCFRGKTDCEPVSCIDAMPKGTSEEDFMNLNYVPLSFVCSGIINNKKIKQDCYRLCFKNSLTDEMTDNDEQDMTHLMSVISTTLAVGATRKVKSGAITVPTMQA